MNEEEWMACADSMQMWGWLVRTGRANGRCKRVFTACCERIRQGKVRAEAKRRWDSARDDSGDHGDFALENAERHILDATGGALYSCSDDAGLAVMLRDIFGNPFRSLVIDPNWRTSDVLFLARAAEKEPMLLDSSLQPTRMLLLADALEDAGCTSVDLLEHLRGPGPHVRGCWALDLVLGR